MIKRSTREDIAYHEAGHAIAHWRQYVEFKHVTIKPDGNSLGHVLRQFPKWFNPELESTDRQRLYAERYIIASFAGQIAEAKFRGRKPRFGMSDNQQAVEMACRFCGPEDTTEAYLHYCFLASRDLVNATWKWLEAVAQALLERETLSYKEIMEVITALH